MLRLQLLAGKADLWSACATCTSMRTSLLGCDTRGKRTDTCTEGEGHDWQQITQLVHFGMHDGKSPVM